MKRRAIALAALFGACQAGLIAGCSGGDHRGSATQSPSPTPSSDGPTLTRTVFMRGLSAPWDMAFTPDGALLFTEKCRGLSVRRADGSIQRLFGSAGSAVVATDLFCEGQSGVHGVAIDPDFANNRTVFVYTASDLGADPRTNRVVRLVVDSGYTTVSGRTDIVTDIPYKNSGNAVGDPGAHSGGRIRFGPDRFLYITTGDNHDASLPQDLMRLGGKVLRVDQSGAAAPGNDTPAGGDPRIFSYGHRNVQGIAFHPGSGQPFTSEHGPNHSDEVTALVAGGNAGWDPQKRPGLDCPDDYCGYAGSPSTMPMTDTTRFPNAMRPSWNNDGRSQGMGPNAFLVGAQWKEWEGRLAVGLMAGTRVDVLQLDAAGTTIGTATMNLPPHRPRSLVQGPDGNLYVATDSGEIWRVAPN